MNLSVVQKAEPSKKVAVVCGAPSSEFLAPFDNPEWEIWVLGNRLDRYKDRRVTRIFEIHDDLSEHGDVQAYTSYLIASGIPLVVGANFPSKAQAKGLSVFPFAQANELYGSEYLTSSTAYMVAMALLEGFTEIGVYGSDMAIDDTEYFWQRPCLEAWVGFARGRGTKVYIPEVSALGKSTRVEGRKSGGKHIASGPFTASEFLAVAQMHETSANEKAVQIRQLENQIQVHGGAQQAYERLAKVARAVEGGQVIQTLTATVRIK